MSVCQSCAAAIPSGPLCPDCAAGQPQSFAQAASPATLVPLVKNLLLQPFATIRSLMGTADITAGAVLLLVVLGVKVLAHTGWWLVTPRAVFGFQNAMVGWIGAFIYIGAWVASLALFARGAGAKVQWGQVLNGVSGVWLVPTLVSALITISPVSLRTAVGVLNAASSVYLWLGLFGVARVLSDGDERGAFRLMLFSALTANAIRIVWNAAV